MKFTIKNPKKGTRVEFEEFADYAILFIRHDDARYAWKTTSLSSFSPEEGSLDIFVIEPSDDYEGYGNLGPKPNYYDCMQIVFKDMSREYDTIDYYTRDKETEYLVFLKKDWWLKAPISKQEEIV